MREAVEMVVKSLVDDVDAVDVREVDQQGQTLIEVRVAPSDMGKIIGRQGLTIVARTVRARGLKGELVADLLTDFPERFERISRLLGIGPSGKCEELQLENYWFQNDRVVLKFVGYDSIESA